MTEITADKLNEIAALTDALPEKYQVAAFRELVRHELTDARPAARATDTNGGTTNDASDRETSDSPNRPTWFSKVLEQMPDVDFIESGGRDGQAAWALIELFSRGEKATVATARTLIKDELGVSPESRSHMSDRLGKDFTPKYATRVPDGRGYRYEPTVKITEKFPKEPDLA